MRTRPLVILGFVAAIGLSANGPVSASASASHPPPRTVTASSNNETVRIHVGDKLKVHLDTSFRRPRSSRPKVLERLSYSGGYSTESDARATFKARATGRADITSETDYPCLHTTPQCEIAQQVWVVHIVVVR